MTRLVRVVITNDTFALRQLCKNRWVMFQDVFPSLPM